jgi:hypothetical protein
MNNTSFCNLRLITPRPPFALGFVTIFQATRGGF